MFRNASIIGVALFSAYCDKGDLSDGSSHMVEQIGETPGRFVSTIAALPLAFGGIRLRYRVSGFACDIGLASMQFFRPMCDRGDR